MIEDAVQDYKKSSLKRLHDRDKLNPDAINARVKRYVEKHRESINARRRDKRQNQKKVLTPVPTIAPESSVSSVETPKLTNENIITHITKITTTINRKPRAPKKNVIEPVSYPPILKENVTVSFGI